MTKKGLLAGLKRRLFGVENPDPWRIYAYLGPDMALVRLKDGHLLYVDPQEESVCHHLIASGRWEPWGHAVIKQLVSPGDHVLEVGAHVGSYTMTLAKRVGAKGSVTSVEANPRLAGLTDRSIRINGYAERVTLIQKAASDAAGVTRFTTSRRFAGGGHLHIPDAEPGPDTVEFDVDMIRLDDLDLAPISLIRIDAEGAEPLILKGAETLLSRPDIVVYMEWDTVQMASRADVGAFVAWLTGQGFGIWRVTETSTLSPLPPAALATLKPCDIVLSRKPPVLAG